MRATGIMIGVMCLCTSALAQQKGELWENTMSMQSAGMTMPPMTQQDCRLPNPEGGPTPPMEPGCQIVEQKRSGNKFNFKYACDNQDGKYTGSGEFENSKDSFKGVMKSEGTRDGKPFNMTMNMSGKKLGTCDYVDKKKQVEDMVAKAQADQAKMMAKECDEGIAKLEAYYFIPDPNNKVPPEAMICKDRKAEFCAHVATIGKSMSTRDGYKAAVSKYGRDKWEGTAKLCGYDYVGLRTTVCGKALTDKDFDFARLNCQSEVAQFRKQNCEGKDPKSLSKDIGEACSNLGGLDYSAASTTSSADAQKTDPNATKPSSATDKIKEGADKLKKFLKF